jgi:hypothetical protein
VLIAETGAEDEERLPWLAYIVEQTLLALERGVPVQGICWYPFLDYPGWDNGRYCPTGVFGYPDGEGERAAFHPLHVELAQVPERIAASLRRVNGRRVEGRGR